MKLPIPEPPARPGRRAFGPPVAGGPGRSTIRRPPLALPLLAVVLSFGALAAEARRVRDSAPPPADRGLEAPVFADGFESGDTSGWSLFADGIWRPQPGTTWQWQLSGTLDTSYDVQMYDLDLFDTPGPTIVALRAAGRAVVCYLSAGSWEDWRPDAGAYPPALLGNELDGWPGERWVDIRRLDLLGPILAARFDLAVEKGCTGVEPDNVDAYQNASGFPLTAADQLAFNLWLAAAAHARGLSVGLKNDLDQIPDLVGAFDWALDEQCWEYDECAALAPFVAAGKAVFGVEYTGDPAQFCPPLNALGYSWLKKELDLGPWRIDCHDLAP